MSIYWHLPGEDATESNRRSASGDAAVVSTDRLSGAATACTVTPPLVVSDLLRRVVVPRLQPFLFLEDADYHSSRQAVVDALLVLTHARNDPDHCTQQEHTTDCRDQSQEDPGIA